MIHFISGTPVFKKTLLNECLCDSDTLVFATFPSKEGNHPYISYELSVDSGPDNLVFKTPSVPKDTYSYYQAFTALKEEEGVSNYLDISFLKNIEEELLPFIVSTPNLSGYFFISIVAEKPIKVYTLDVKENNKQYPTNNPGIPNVSIMQSVDEDGYYVYNVTTCTSRVFIESLSNEQALPFIQFQGSKPINIEQWYSRGHERFYSLHPENGSIDKKGIAKTIYSVPIEEPPFTYDLSYMFYSEGEADVVINPTNLKYWSVPDILNFDNFLGRANLIYDIDLSHWNVSSYQKPPLNFYRGNSNLVPPKWGSSSWESKFFNPGHKMVVKGFSNNTIIISKQRLTVETDVARVSVKSVGNDYHHTFSEVAEDAELVAYISNEGMATDSLYAISLREVYTWGDFQVKSLNLGTAYLYPYQAPNNLMHLTGRYINPYQSVNDIVLWTYTREILSLNGFMENSSTLVGNVENLETSSVIDMENAFKSSALKSDLSGWCVSDILEKPEGFAEGSLLSSKPEFFPVWGTCPIREDEDEGNYSEEIDEGLNTTTIKNVSPSCIRVSLKALVETESYTRNIPLIINKGICEKLPM